MVKIEAAPVKRKEANLKEPPSPTAVAPHND